MLDSFQSHANFIWQVADDLLRNTYKRSEYGGVTLPFVVLRRLDCVLNQKSGVVREAYMGYKAHDYEEDEIEQIMLVGGEAEDLGFFNSSPYDLERLTSDGGNIEVNFSAYLNGFSSNVREILGHYDLPRIAQKLAKNDLLYLMCDKFTEVDLHPDRVSNHQMGSIFEELLRRFSEMSNETAGEHYTPREVIGLMIRLLMDGHEDRLDGPGVVRTVFDPACGTGGMLALAKEHIQRINPEAQVNLFGQEINDQSYAIAKSDFLVTGEDPGNVRLGSSLSEDRFPGAKFDFMLSNPPFGVSWKKERAFVEEEAGHSYGRFSAGTPRISDGALLFLQHMVSKMEPQGSRMAIVFNGSPLFTGDAGSGESEIRRWILESDLLETIVALPTEMFYNTGIATYVWILTNTKAAKRRGKVQLVDASEMSTKMRKSLGNKRNYLTAESIDAISTLVQAFEEGEHVRIFPTQSFGYTKVRVERPLLTPKGKPKTGRDGSPKPDTKKRDYERVPLSDDIDAYF